MTGFKRTSSAGSEDDVAAKGAFNCHGAVDAGVDGEGGGGAVHRREKYCSRPAAQPHPGWRRRWQWTRKSRL
jgi:hypothetical protein